MKRGSFIYLFLFGGLKWLPWLHMVLSQHCIKSLKYLKEVRQTEALVMVGSAADNDSDSSGLFASPSPVDFSSCFSQRHTMALLASLF